TVLAPAQELRYARHSGQWTERWTGMVRPSRRALRALLRMRSFVTATLPEINHVPEINLLICRVKRVFSGWGWWWRGGQRGALSTAVRWRQAGQDAGRLVCAMRAEWPHHLVSGRASWRPRP